MLKIVQGKMSYSINGVGTPRWPSGKKYKGESLLHNICCCYSVAKSRPTLCNPMNCSTPGFPVLHYLWEFAQTHVH